MGHPRGGRGWGLGEPKVTFAALQEAMGSELCCAALWEAPSSLGYTRDGRRDGAIARGPGQVAEPSPAAW